MLLETPQPSNVACRLGELAATHPDATAIITVSADGDTRHDYADLERRARCIASWFVAHDAVGRRALLLADSGIDYVAAFFGCLYAGVIAVPVYPPESAREQHLARLRGIAQDCDAAYVLTTGDIDEKHADALAAIAPGAAIVVIDRVCADPGLGDMQVAPRVIGGGDDIAFLQYTSGSTAAPKGVMVSHANIFANENAIKAGLGVTTEDVFVSWLPLYHDMGLIGSLLQPIHSGIPLVLMSPQFFLERPVRWLEAIARHRGTISGGPDFAYRLCCERVRDTQIGGLDLSSWRVAFCGSEPVRHDTQEDFAERFAAAGFDADARYPCYGLAEATLFVSGGTRGVGLVSAAFAEADLRAGRARADAQGARLVQCGRAAFAHDIQIVDPDSRATLPDGDSGEIWVSGPSIAHGYWQNATASNETFVEHDGVRWLRTGDLGFRHDGGLYVVGRRKDMIIVRGQNLYPQDIERIIEAEVDVVRKGRVAAFGVTLAGREGIGVAVEVSRSTQKLVPPQALVDALNEAVSVACGEPLSLAVLLQPGALPKTSSGKLQRAATAQRWQQRDLDAYAIYEAGQFVDGAPAAQGDAADVPLDALETELATLWSDVLERTVATADAHFFSLGGSSLRATQLTARIRERWQLRFEMADLFAAPVLRRCAAVIAARIAAGESYRTETIVAASDDIGRYPASLGQRRFWFLWQMDRLSNAYHMAGGLAVHGVVDIAALHVALDALARQHGALRTTFAADEAADVVQIVQAPAPIAIAEIDARHCADRVDALLHTFVGTPFDLVAGPLWRAAIIRVGETDSRIVLAMHHVVADGWSVDLLLDELARRYGVASEGEAQRFAPPLLRYPDYAHWQRRWVETAEKTAQLQYWRAQLTPPYVPLVLPVDQARTPATDHPAGHLPFAIPDELRDALRQVEREQGLTFFTVSIAAFALALYAYTGESDIRIGVPLDGRARSALRELVGFCVNTQVVRCQIAPHASLSEALHVMRTAVLGAQDKQDLPFDLLVDALRPERGAAGAPLFDVMYGHQPAIDGVVQAMAGVTAHRFRVPDQTVPFELTLDTYEAADGQVSGTFTYAADLFAPQTIDGIAARYRALLAAFAADTDRRVADALSDGDSERSLLLSWSGSMAADNAPPLVIDAIAQRAARDPDAIAVIEGTGALRYEALNARANQLAHRLIQMGVGQDVRVGIAVERSIDMIVGLLAILKAGGAYVPLDPSYPRDRLAYMLEDSRVDLLLTQSHVRDRVPAAHVSSVIEIDRVDLSAEPVGNPSVAVHPDSLAYVIYTSGSTGKPKGVGISQRALAIHTSATIDFCRMTAADRVLQFATFSFDGFVEEMYPTLSVGAAMVLRGEDLWDSKTLYQKLHAHRISIIDVTTAYWHLLAQDFAAAGPRDYGALRLAIAGGEAMALEGVKAWRAAGLQHVTLLNTYGPTETTVSSTLFDCAAMLASHAHDGRVPIGRALPGRRVYVLDARGELAPRGVSGELCIGGPGVARGYLNRSALTAERFVPDPFDGEGGRLYRTGDLVRWRADGVLEYLGRIDHQVKIRGFRIELGEVEAQLLAHPAVREAVVVAQDVAGGTRLVGYVTAQPDQMPTPEALRVALAALLPDYMVPGAIVVLDRLPLTPSGKVDRKALPVPAPIQTAQAYAAPRGDVEGALARIWQDLLGVERIGRDDNFFALGGDSILSLKAVARAHDVGLQFTPRQLFDAQTVAALALALAGASGSGVPPLRPCASRDRQRLPLSYAQQRLWFLWHLQPESTAYHMAGALRLQGVVDAQAVRASFAALVARHESLRTTFEADASGQAVQVIGVDARFDWRHVDAVDAVVGASDRQDGQAVRERIGAALAGEPFDLTSGPLLRVALIRVQPDEHVLAVSMHHIVSDGWSVEVLLEEFVAAYRATVMGEALSLPVLPVQYADYALWQRDWLEAGERERQLAYWRETLGDDHPVLALPSDHPRQAIAQYPASTLPVALPPSIAEAVRRTAGVHGTTPFVVLLTAFTMLLHRYTGQTDIRVGSPVANRDRPETAGVVGLFVNMQVLRAHLHDRMPLTALLDDMKATVRDAQAHADLPFDVLVDALQPERSLSHTPLFQVMFNHLREDDRVLNALPGMTVAWLPPLTGMAQCELTLTTTESVTGAMSASLTYAETLFDAATMVQFGRHYVSMLAALTDASAQVLSDVTLLSERERDALLAQGTCPEPYPDAMPVHARIALAARTHPERLAVRYGETRLSYGELDARANQLAHRLVALGVGPEVGVGIAVERSVEMVVGLLAILKAGGAYVPLDPEYPQERLAYMLDDSRIRLLLTQSWIRARLPLSDAVTLLDLDTIDVSQEPVDAPSVGVHGDNVAYVIYTSGSTGRPKGAANRHSALTNRLAWMQAAYRLDAHDVVLQKTPFSFDVSVWEFFWPLVSGAGLALAEPGAHRDPQRLVASIAAHAVTTLHFVPSMLQAFVDHAGVRACTGLTRIVCSGEALPADLANRTLALLPRAALYNLYGPTEAAIDVTHWQCRPGDAVVPIGNPIGNVSTHVLDRSMQLVPRGVAGELYLGGAGLARGYLYRPALSAERFVPDPFDPNGARLYRTGDLVRWSAQGALEYLGRLDHQVKIRGFRIELGEIETQLVQAGAREAVVTAQEGPGGTRLVAYVTAQTGPARDVHADVSDDVTSDVVSDVAKFRIALARHLPDYMVPGVIVILDALPLNANGKVDRKALPAPTYQVQGYQPPEGAAETALAAIWQAVLGVDRVGRHDNFFELGGDSILSLQIVARARQAGWHVSSRQLFEHQTVGLLATVARRTDVDADVDADAVAVQQEQGSVPLLPIQSWFFATPVANRSHWNQAVLLEGEVMPDSAALAIALDAVVAHHGALRLRFTQASDGTWQQAYAADADVGMTGALLWEREGRDAHDIEALCDAAQRSVNLADGPVLRAVLIRLPEGQWRLLLAIHHLVVDGVSWRILLADLEAAYRQTRLGRSVTLPANGTTYQAWADRLVEAAQLETTRAELPYWQTVLETSAHIPVDRDTRTSTVADLVQSVHQLDRGRTRRLLQDVPAAYRTQINDVLLTALGRALCTWTGRDAIRIDVEGHGREDLFDDVDLSRTVGWFTSLYPVKLDTSGEPGAALKRVKESLRSVPRRGIGFGLLRYLGDAQTQSALQDGASSVVFNYLGQFDGASTEADRWQMAMESTGASQDPHATPTHAFSFDAKVYDGSLTVTLSYDSARFHAATADALLTSYIAELDALIAHCACGVIGVTPSDFPLAALTQAQLDALPVGADQMADLYPLSPMQSGMLFHTLYAPEGGAYLNQLRVDVEGLDVARFRAAWEAVSERHTTLRTGFVQQDEGWLQWVAQRVTLPFAEHDGRARSDGVEALDALARAELARGFDLACPPLQRIVLVRTGAQRHHLIWTHHHLLLDGWSVSMLMGEVLRHYDGHTLSAPTGRYRDYIAWLQARDEQAGEAYWRGVLAQMGEPTRLAASLPQDTQDSGTVAQSASEGQDEQLLEWSEPATAALVALARRCRVTVNVLVQAAWAMVLQRWTGQASVVFGATVSGRPVDLAGTEQLLGLFINTVPVITSPRGDAVLGDWLSALQAQGVASQEQAHTPLFDIQRWSGAGSEGLFDTLIVFENYPVDAALRETAPGGLVFGAVGYREETNYALTLGVTLGARLAVAATSARTAIAATSVARMLAQMQRVLDAFVSGGASVRIREIALLDDAARAHLLTLGRNDALSVPTRLVHERIRRQAELTPDAIAIVYGDARLTYGELEQRANRLAHRLVARGVGPEVRVGIAVARSIEMVVGLLAILKAGGAYVPLDPDYPSERLAYMIEDSGIALTLTQRAVRATLGLADAAVIELDALDLSAESSAAPDVRVDDDHLAYVIYTSGSTGRPKGVGLPHRAFSRHVHVSVGLFDLNERDRVLQFSTLNFDGFVEQLFPALTIGARVVLRGPALWDSATFREQLVSHGITVADVTTAYWQLLTQDLDSGTLPDLGGLRRLHAGGEAMSPQTLHLWHRVAPVGITLANTYGPTEAAVTASAYLCDTDAARHTRLSTVPIGRPLGGRTLAVMDADLRLAPYGATGELCIGGALLARGYLNRPGLTAERFVPDPSDAHGGRLYRTGDLARWNAQGELVYVGRIDHQLKVRGFRVELGEIEAQLLAQPDVREAIAMGASHAGTTRVVAYVSAQAGRALDAADLRSALARSLPDYMVPAAIMVLDALPLNPNGKVDRKALPEPAYRSDGHEAPQGALETTIATIWSDVLSVAQVGRRDNFFALGGDSILVMKVATRLRAATGDALSLPSIFGNPTIAGLADHIATLRQASKHDQAEPVLHRIARETATDATMLPLSPAQRRVWIASRLAGPTSSAYNVSASVRLDGDVSAARLSDALARLVARHDILRTRYPDHDGLPHTVIDADGAVDFSIHDLREIPVDQHPARLREITLDRLDRPFDLAGAALLRATLVRIDARQALLMLSMHHILCDGWSMDVLVRDFCAFYAAGAQAVLPPLPVQYVDYAAWHTALLDGARGTALKDFWQRQLAGARGVLDLPADYPRPATVADAGDALHATLDTARVARLARFARAHQVTPFVVLLSAFQVLLHRLTGSRDVLVGTDVAGRTRVELEQLIGFFVNVVPLRLTVAPAGASVPVAQLIAHTHATAVAALEHQDLPFDQIARCARYERDATRNPLVQALFVSQSKASAPIALPGVVAELIKLPASHSKFDMALFVTEGDTEWEVEWVFATALFQHATIQRWLDQWLRLVEDIMTQSDLSLAGDTPSPAVPDTAKPAARVAPGDKFAKLKKIASRGSRAASAPEAAQADVPARISLLQPGRIMPVVLEPLSADVDPIAWAARHRDFIDATLARHAVILFRNFRLPTPQAFESFADAMSPGLYGNYGDLPKKEGGKRTYRSTPYPEREMILYHNESAHLEQWPRKQWFFCELPSRVGGTTPIVDCREMLRELPADIVERFATKGLIYSRTFTDRLDVSWRDFFGTDDREVVARRLDAAGTAFCWLDNDGLQTRSVSPGVITHPVSGERCFFNQVQLHHPYFLKPDIRRDLLDMVGVDYLPRNVFYGDGSPIDDATMARIGEAYARCAVRFEWRKGDVVLLDNMLSAHARDPYEEPRKIVVAMGEMVSRASVTGASGTAQDAADNAVTKQV
ncbi:non-ribosomal peptide synthase/polyketide synthase [Robbsia sp. KACC 23696]|uniref:non-ribosomal peptide synthase/polyketide synthase n=1 Tax=Robbsia sp. KACC 23696 TaxID=3149231 RepID=UPI00325C0F9C